MDVSFFVGVIFGGICGAACWEFLTSKLRNASLSEPDKTLYTQTQTRDNSVGTLIIEKEKEIAELTRGLGGIKGSLQYARSRGNLTTIPLWERDVAKMEELIAKKEKELQELRDLSRQTSSSTRG